MPPKLKRNEILKPLLLVGGLTLGIIFIIAAQVSAL
ncbi:MAG: hypothetical protein RI921_142 [Chloroflexota bacterium]|jgi:hypothetical protein